jgi:LPLT family lysophospholipid transporter-like MFS transporter
VNRAVQALLGAQFLTALADNAVLFTAVAIALQARDTATWYVPALQAGFLVAFVVFAPWVGAYADRRAKASVLLTGNAIKFGGAVAMWLGLEPVLAYAAIGVGAAVYGPAKYGILPELVSHDQLVKANGWVEGSTIAAIVLGTVVGARIADQSTSLALLVIAGCYLASLGATLLIPRHTGAGAPASGGPVHFVAIIRQLFLEQRARFAMLGTSLFWATSAVLRLLLVAWAPVVLATRNTADIADLTLALAVGLVIGSLVVPRLIPIDRLRRARLAAYAMGGCVLLLAAMDSVWPARGALLGIGFTGGLFIVPVNAALQEIGHRTIGSGGVIAVQNFFENVAMLASVATYTAAAGLGVPPVTALLVTGGVVLVITALVSAHLPPDGTASEAPR